MQDEDEIAARYICADCIGEAFLKREIKINGAEQICHYCGDEYNCYTLGQLADLVDIAFAVHYERTDTEPTGYEYAMMADKESNYEWERPGDKAVYAIMDTVHSTEGIAEDIQTLLKDKHYSFDDALKIDLETIEVHDVESVRF